jgi:hypothetical protein
MNRLDQLAKTLFVKFEKQIPLKELAGSGRGAKKITADVVRRKLDVFHAETRQFRRENRLWVLNWARVILKLQQLLLAAGYPLDVVKPLLLSMIISTSKSK